MAKLEEITIGSNISGIAGHEPVTVVAVKGRQKGADTVTVTKNEILRAFNKPDEYILSIAEVILERG